MEKNKLISTDSLITIVFLIMAYIAASIIFNQQQIIDIKKREISELELKAKAQYIEVCSEDSNENT